MMRSKSFLNCVLALVLSFVSIESGYSQLRTPFEKREISAEGKRVYKFENPNLSVYSLTFLYGFQPMNSLSWYNSQIFDSQYSADVHFPSVTDGTTGSFSASFNIMATPWLEVCIPFSLTYNNGTLYNTMPYSRRGDYREMWLSMTPNVKISWAYNDWMHLYSRFGVGWALGNRYQGLYGGTQVNHTFGVAWQVSPVGIELGRRVCFFTEFGYGTFGKINLGVKFRFNDSDDPSNKASGWYYNYL